MTEDIIRVQKIFEGREQRTHGRTHLPGWKTKIMCPSYQKTITETKDATLEKKIKDVIATLQYQIEEQRHKIRILDKSEIDFALKNSFEIARGLEYGILTGLLGVQILLAELTED